VGLIALILGIAVQGCSDIKYTDMLGKELAPVEVDKVLVYETEEDFKTETRDYDVLGYAVATGSSISSRGSMRSSVTRMAARKGADAVVFVDISDLAAVKDQKYYIPAGDTVRTEGSPPQKRVKAYFLKFR